MGKWAAVLGLVGLVAGCNYGGAAYSCSTNEQCGAGGQCEADHLCSVPSSTCPSGRAYGDLTGKTGTCVGGGLPGEIDASIDSPIPVDAQLCFGTGLVQVCLAAPPSQPLVISTPTMIDTGDPSMCATLTRGGNVCVLAATDITINQLLRASGAKPLVLVASGSITSAAAGTIDVGSHRIRAQGAPETGAGSDPTTCAPGMPPANSGGGGGAGGSFLGLGGAGGAGGNNVGTPGTPGAAVTTLLELRGGCPGQDGQGNGKGIGGHGGGAVFLIAGTKIDLKGAVNAAGEGGDFGAANVSGAGGGGAGGMIGFEAPVITSTGLLLASGGGGGGGSGPNNAAGTAGADPSTTTAADGGTGNGGNGGDGGKGSVATAAAPGLVGKPGDNTGTVRGGGGGGGGGAGIIKAPATASLGTSVSPAPTP